MLSFHRIIPAAAAWLIAVTYAGPGRSLHAQEPLVLIQSADDATEAPLVLLPAGEPITAAAPAVVAREPSPQPVGPGPLMLVTSEQDPEQLPLVLQAAARDDAMAQEDVPRPLDELRTDIRATGELPPRATDALMPPPVAGQGHGRGWGSTCYQWEASALYHEPLYFEDVPLERYGHSLRPVLQPFASGAKFFASVPFLPYKAVLEPPIEHVYALGYYRPGSPTPRLRYRLPIRYDAAAVQAGIVVGLILVLP